MCGVAGIFGRGGTKEQLEAMVKAQHHRGPGAQGFFYPDQKGAAALGHNRLSIIDLSEAGNQPMPDPSGRYRIVFNGEIYNYLELRSELESTYSFRTKTDTEVLLAAFTKWGPAGLHRFVGMFAFMIWDEKNQSLFAARDRFGVKPLYYHFEPASGRLILASEIKAIHAAGIRREADPVAWSTYLTYGLYDHGARTFWKNIQALSGGHQLEWRNGKIKIFRWYDLAAKAGADEDSRPAEKVEEEYLSLLQESVRLRFRSDVPVGINLSGGLDSSTLLGLVQKVQGPDSPVKAFTFVTGDPHYDEIPWVKKMLERTKHPSVVCALAPEEVPPLAEDVQFYQDEPFGGLPTLAYAKLFQKAREEGEIVLLEGQGMDEQWAGYDYYASALKIGPAPFVQGIRENLTKPDCLLAGFRAFAERFDPPKPFSDSLRNLQYRDILFTKIPRALRFNDRVSMRSSTELREPFLDHRLVELALRQPAERKIHKGTNKWLLRRMTQALLPEGVAYAPKRPVQTPQREWLRSPLRGWATEYIEEMLGAYGKTWFDPQKVREAWSSYCAGESGNSFYVWQWISIGLMMKQKALR